MLEIKKKKGEKLTEGKILPKDDVTVFGTGSSSFMKSGTEHIVHSHLAKQLVAAGKAVYDLEDVPEQFNYSNIAPTADDDFEDPDAPSAAAAAALAAGKASKKDKAGE